MAFVAADAGFGVRTCNIAPAVYTRKLLTNNGLSESLGMVPYLVGRHPPRAALGRRTLPGKAQVQNTAPYFTLRLGSAIIGSTASRQVA